MLILVEYSIIGIGIVFTSISIGYKVISYKIGNSFDDTAITICIRAFVCVSKELAIALKTSVNRLGVRDSASLFIL